MEAERDARLKVVEAQKKQLEEQIKLIEKQVKDKEKIIDGINDEIKAMKDANAERQRQIDLQKAQYELERMQNQRTKMVYSESKGMYYTQDLSGVRDAKQKVESAQLEIEVAQKEKQIDLIEKEIDLLNERKDEINEQIDILDEEMDKINEYYDELIKNTEKMYDQMIKDTEKMYDQMIREAEKYWDSMIEGLEKYKSRFEELAELEENAKVIDGLKKLGITTEDIMNMSAEAFEKFKDRYVAALYGVYEGNDSMQDSISEALGAIGEFESAADSITPITSAIEDASNGMDNLSNSASSVSKSASDAASNLDDAATNARTLRDNLTDVNDIVSDEETAFGNLKKKIDDVIQAINDKIEAIKNEQNAVNIAISDEMANFLLLRNKIIEVKDTITDLGNAITDLDSKTLNNLTTAFVNLHTKIMSVATILGVGIETQENSAEGVASSIASAIQALNDISLEDGIIAQFNNLKTAIDEVTAAIGGGGETSGSEGKSGGSGSGGSGSGGGEGGSGGSLTDAITQMGETANEVIGEPQAEGDGTVIGEFGSFKTAVNETSDAIGSEDTKDDENLIGSIVDLGETTREELGESGGDGVIGRFEEFRDVIGDAEKHVKGISEGLDEIDGKEVECTITVNVKMNGSIPAFASGTVLGNMKIESATYNAKYGDAYASGTIGLPKAEKNALVSEYGQTEMTVFPNGKTVITDSPTLMDLPKDTVIFNEDQTKKIIDNKTHVNGTAHAQGTADDGIIITPDGNILRPLQPGDRAYELQQKMNDYLAKMGGDTASLLVPVNAMQKNMEQMVQSLNTVNSINNSNNRMQNVVNEFHITMPNVTDSTAATELMKDLQALATKKMQFFD